MDQKRLAGFLMGFTYAVGAGGLGWALSTAFSGSPDLRWPCLLAVGITGIASWVRHSVLNRADAARMGWDSGTTNPFQVEVGLANLAWGVLAVLAAMLAWGLAVYSACFLVFGFYMAYVAVYKAMRASGGHPEEWRTVFPAASYGVLMIIVGAAGFAAIP